MTKKTFALIAAILAASIFILTMQHRRIQRLAGDLDRYRNNTETLLSDVETFRVRDSLSAARVQSLELSLKEFERFRAEDAALIKALKARNRDLQDVSKAQTQTIMELSAVVRDTVIIRDSVPLPVLQLHAGDAWYDFDGFLDGRNFTGTMVCRDSLRIAEFVQYKRFLGFLWKTNKIKSREIDAVSSNPHTQITGLEFISIEK